MKTELAKSIVASLLFIFISTNGFCQKQVVKPSVRDFFSEFYVYQVKPMVFELTYHYPNKDRVTVVVVNEEGSVLFTEKSLVYKKYKKVFDLSAMNDGKFSFKLSDGDITYVHSFEVQTITERFASRN